MLHCIVALLLLTASHCSAKVTEELTLRLERNVLNEFHCQGPSCTVSPDWIQCRAINGAQWHCTSSAWRMLGLVLQNTTVRCRGDALEQCHVVYALAKGPAAPIGALQAVCSLAQSLFNLILVVARLMLVVFVTDESVHPVDVCTIPLGSDGYTPALSVSVPLPPTTRFSHGSFIMGVLTVLFAVGMALFAHACQMDRQQKQDAAVKVEPDAVSQ